MSRVWVVALLLTISFRAFSQESNCGDGIDNDGDGFIDCYDSDCSASVICKDFFIGGDKLCQAAPLSFPQFKMKAFQQSPNRTAHSLGRVSIGDLDRDGIPEVVSVHTFDKKLYILRGSDLSIKYTANTTGSPQYDDIAIGNIKNDNCGEIFIAEESGGKWYVSSYDCQAKLLWRTQVYGQPFDLGLADFDGDGKVEVYYRNEILDAETGTILVKGTGNWTTIDAGPVAVDIFDDGYCTECPGLELVLGGSIYAVDLTPRSANAGALILQASMPRTTNGNLKYWPKLNDWGYINTATSVADYNLDGYLDVLVSGAAETYKSNGSVDQTTKGPTTVYFWDIKNNRSKAFQPSNNWQRGTGRLNIADIDGDGKQNTTFVTGSRLYALDENFNQLWVNTSIVENTSGFTGTTVFDFNNDGAVETVYRDESYLYIINGKDGSTYASTPCKSRTANEYPIVADVNGDGITEICVTCATDNNASIEPSDNQRQGHVRTYTSDLEPWVPARKIWNQHGYFNVNINDDLTIPKIQQKHHLVFSTAQCETGPGSIGPNRPLNTFLNQSAYLDSKGCATYASPDINFVANSLSIQPPTCPDQNFTVSFSIRNSGDMALSGSLPITFYSGNPKVAGAVKLNTTTINLTQLGVNGTYNVSNMTVNGTGNTFTMYAVLNDAGTSVPTPIILPNSNFVECNYDNNIVSAQITPAPFPVQAALISDNFQCGAGTGIPNGAVEAYRLVGGVKETTNYTFYWFNGTTVGDTTAAVFKGAVWTGLTEGTYSVVAYHKGFRCGSGSAQVTVGVRTKTLNVAIAEDKSFTKCKNPDGKMTASVNGGEPVGNFTYEWFKGTVFGTSPILSKSHVINNVDGELYSVLVTDKATGCQIIASAQVTDQTIKPVVTASATDANCNPSNSGTVSANVAGNTSNYNFYWYSGTSIKPSPDYTGSTINSLTAGNYVVVAENKNTECTSLPVMVTIGSKTSPTVTATVTHQQTSCALPNGSASASVSGAGIYAYKWYRGNSTLAADQIMTSTTASITGLAAGQYTVEATNTTTGCADTELFTITDVISTPSVSSSIISHQTNCTPFNGSVSASANGSAGPFQYYWFNGNVGTPDTLAANFKGVNYSGLQAGYFTVVAVDKITRCASPRSLIEVLNNTAIPTITTSTVDQTSCDTTAPNGQISANISGATTGYTFTWYAGSGPGGAVVGNTPSVSSREAGIYTVRAVNNTTGCSNTAQVTVIDDKVTPDVTATVNQHQTICSSGNGQVSANVGGATAGYTFYWFNGNISTPNIASPDFTGAVYNNRVAGFYTVVAVSNATKCQSVKATVQVLDDAVLPAITTATVSQTSCDSTTPNGEASANVGGVTTGFTFDWYAGSTVTGTVLVSSPTLTGRTAGTYTVKVTSDATGCSSTSQVTITNNMVNPVVTANIDAHQTICSSGNGQVSASVSGATAGYTFYWFNGNISTPNIASADFTGAAYNNRVAGFYTVVAVSNATKCQSVKATVQVLDDAVPPAITTATVNQTSCDSTTPNGEASANVGGVTTGFTFDWYGGSTATGTVLVSDPTLTGRAAGTYTVKVTNDATGCSSTAQVTITNYMVNPVVTANIDAHQTICSSGNGQLSASVSGATAGYNFYWFNGNISTPNIASADFTGAVYNNRVAGFYTVVAVSNATKCQSAKATVQVLDDAVPPAITTATVNQTSCDSTTPNGEASANVGGVTTGFTFDWYGGSTATGTVLVSDPTLTGRAAGTYTVKVTSGATGCSSIAQVTITNNLVNPVVTASIDAHQTICSSGNGQVSASVSGATAGYTFYWFNGNISTPNIASADFTGAVYNNRVAGFYTVVAVSNATKCQSAKATVQVLDDAVPPAITTATISQTSCDSTTPNGEASANVGGITAGYTFDWYTGSTATGTVLVPDPTLTGRAAGTYTVKVTSGATGCSSIAQVTITNNMVNPVVTASIDAHQTICSSGNGQVSANVDGSTTGYTFYWFNGNISTPNIASPDFTGAVYNNRVAGFYTVVAVSNATKCQSAKATVQVLDNSVPPIVSATPSDNTACDPTKSNGEISANVAGVTTNHTFHIFSGQNTLAINEVTGSPSAVVLGLPSGIYTVQAIDNTTGCAGTTEVTINNNITLPAITATATDVTVCSPPNGSIIANITNGIGVIADYTFFWYDGNQLKAIVDHAETGATLNNIPAGTYTVSAFNNALGCDVQSPFTIDVENGPTTLITITELIGEQIQPAVCNDGQGQLGVVASSPANALGFSFSWYAGDKNTGMTFEGNGQDFPIKSNRISNVASGEGISSGLHTVIALDNSTGCQDSLSIHLPYSDEAALLSVLTFAQTDCLNPDGAFSATIDPSDGTRNNPANASLNQGWYKIQVWQNGSNILTVPGDPTKSIDDPIIVTGLSAGNYTVLAVETEAPPLPGCTSLPNDINIDDNRVFPVVIADVLTDNKNCIGAANGNGSIALDIDTSSPVTNYTYAWYDGKLTSDPSLAGTDVLNNIEGGFYTVEVTNIGNNCLTKETFSINNDPYVLSIPSAELLVTDQTDCLPVNGSAEVTDVFIDGVTSGGLGNFTFNWFESDGTTVIPGNNSLVGTALAADQYFVSATNTVSNCATSLTQFKVDDKTVSPAVAATIVDNTFCAGATPNGTITLDINGGVDPLGDFFIEWFEDAALSISLGSNVGVVAGVNDEIAQDLPAGTYFVRVTDQTNPGISCSTVASFSVIDNLPVIAVNTIVPTHQDDCNPNGSALVTDLIVDGISIGTGAPGEYTFNWFESDGTTTIPGSGNTASVGVSLVAGNYFVQATNSTSSCNTSLAPFTINDVHVDPTINAALIVNNSNCSGATPNGAITINTGADPLADFLIEWFEDGTLTISLGTNIGAVAGANNEIAQNLPAGTYYVRVTDQTNPGISCSTVASFSVIDNPPAISIDQANIDITHQADCAPADGLAQVTDIIVDGVAVGSTAGYTFNWFESDGATPIASAGSADLIAVNLAAGNYFVQATNSTSLCNTSPTPFTINDVHVDPTIIATSIINNTNCSGAVPNGAITLSISVNGVVTPLNEFNIEWFEDAAMTNPLIAPVGVVTGTDNEIAQQLGAGTYYIRVTDNTSPNNSCSATASFSIIDNPPVIGIDQANITVTDQSDCAPADGLAQVTDIIVDGVAVGSTAGYTFNWFESDGTTPVATAGNADLIAVNLAAGNYFVQATNSTSLCNTSLVPFSINDVHVDPTINATSIIDNTNCSGATPNGSLTLSISVNGVVAPLNEFTIEWFDDAAMTNPLIAPVGVVAGTDNEIAQQLGAGTYYVRVTDNTSPNNNCSATASFSVIDNPPVISIDQANIDITHQADCAPADGLAQVTDIIVDGVAVGSTAGYTFNWFESDGATPIASAGSADLIAVNLAAGNYFVQATNSTSLCNTSPTPFTINDVHVDPTIIATSIINNTNCSGAVPNGAITLSISVNGVVTPLNEFNIEWFEDAAMTNPLIAPVGVVTGTDNEIAQQLGAGTYYVRVTDNTSPNNSCSATASFSVIDDLPIIGIDQSHISIAHQSDCNPVNGNASVTNITIDHSTLGNTLGYTFTWFESDGTTIIPGSGNTSSVGVALSAGNYFIQATNTTSNCSSPMTPFVIDDVTVTPTIIAVQNFPNISCDTNYTGELSATVSEGTVNGITAGYQFEWFRGANNTNPVDLAGTGTTISNLQEGDYTVQVTDLATPGNGCIGTATINLKREIPILNATLSVNNQTVCLPVNGGINVVSVQQTLMGTTTVFNMSNPASLANFTFQWFDENLNPVSGIINGSAASPNLLAGTYYVQVTNTLGCVTGYTRAVIEDITIHPDVVLDGFNNPSVCILPETTGNLNIIADGSINFSDYTFTWYEGSTASGTVTEANNPILSNIAYTDQLTYTVRVTNNTTNCYSDATYTFATDTVEIRAIASAVPLTSCVTPNGSLFSTVQNGAGPLYNYEWYSGSVIGTSPVFTTNEVLIAPIGMYTVVAKHPSLNFCTSVPGTVEVIDGRMYPVADVTLKAPLTYCDPARPNGVAKAEVNGMVTNHIFEWYEGSATGNLIYTGSEAGSLRATTYFVKAIDVISGCDNTASILIPNAPVIVTAPQIEVLAERTDCLNPNGVLTASVNGNTQDFSFLWYNGNNVKNQPDVISETYYDLYSGAYTVTAMDRVSGCFSSPVSQTIREIFSYPAFEVKSEASNCDEANGTAEVITLNDVEITSIEWDINGAIGYGGIMGELPAGTYFVTATSQLNCSTTEEFTVLPDITVYNGISRNNDGVNDIFEIGCINDFPNNSVKIFNRSGTLVYEAKYYDNQETFFNGVSNRGISLLGNELPSGTYFYIIDKGNGSKPRTGYLELMR